MTIAQVIEAPLINSLITYGPMGLMLAWVLMRGEKKLDQVVERIDKLSHRINGITKAMLVEVISRDHRHGAARQAAQKMLNEMEESQRPVDRGE